MPFPVGAAILGGSMLGSALLNRRSGGSGGGSSPRIRRVPTMTHRQERLQRRLQDVFQDQYRKGVANRAVFQAGKNNLLSLLNGSDRSYEDFTRPALREFQDRILPMLRERLVGGDERYTSSFQNAALEAANKLEEGLNAQRSGLRVSSIGPALQYALAPTDQALQLLQYSFLPKYATGVMPAQPARPSAFAQFASPILSGIGGGLGMGLGAGAAGFGSSLFSRGGISPASSSLGGVNFLG